MNSDLRTPWMLCFSRNGLLRFISHLDWLAMAERILARANLPVSHSEGYRARMIMKSSPPLPIGVESNCELLQIFLDESFDAKTALRRLAEAVPDEIGVEWVQPMRFKPPKNPYKALAAAGYTITFKEDLDPDARQRVIDLLKALIPDDQEPPSGPDPEALKPLWRRLLSLDGVKSFFEGESNDIRIIGKMDSNETLHAAKLGFYLYESAPLTRYPRIVKTGYFRRENNHLEPVFTRK